MREEELRNSVYDPIRTCLKLGQLNNFKREHLEEIDALVKGPALAQQKFLNEWKGSLQGNFLRLQLHLSEIEKKRPLQNWSPLEHKGLCVSLELRDYLGGLSSDERFALENKYKVLVKKIDGKNHQPPELLKQQIRLACVHANQLYRTHKSKDAQNVLNILKNAVKTKLQPANKCRTIMGSIYYLEGKLFRNAGDYPLCERNLAESIKLYSDWVSEHNSGHDRTLASYKTAMALGGIAWCKNMRGFNRDALTIDRKSTRLNSSHIL